MIYCICFPSDPLNVNAIVSANSKLTYHWSEMARSCDYGKSYDRQVFWILHYSPENKGAACSTLVILVGFLILTLQTFPHPVHLDDQRYLVSNEGVRWLIGLRANPQLQVTGSKVTKVESFEGRVDAIVSRVFTSCANVLDLNFFNFIVKVASWSHWLLLPAT